MSQCLTVNIYVRIEYFSLFLSFLDMNMNSIPVHLIQGIVTKQSIKTPNRVKKKKKKEKTPNNYSDTKKMQWGMFLQKLKGQWEMGNNSYQPVWGKLYTMFCDFIDHLIKQHNGIVHW